MRAMWQSAAWPTQLYLVMASFGMGLEGLDAEPSGETEDFGDRAS